MANITTCAVRCVIWDSEGGEPVANAKVTATLSGYEVYPAQGYVVPHETSARTDVNGECILDLWPNELGAVESNYIIKVEALQKRLKTYAVIPNQPTCNLWEVAELPPYDGLDNGSLIIGQVIAAVTAAQAARDVAVAAAGTATTQAGIATNAAATATTQAGIATTAATNAGTSETNASNSATLAQAWAIKTDGPVSGGEFSAKYWAQSIAGGPVASWVGLTGVVTYSQARTALNITNVDNTSDANKPVSTPQQAALDQKVNTSTYTAAMALKADLVAGVVPASQLPSYVDDVLEFANLAAFPATGETGKIYVALDTNRQYRWGGSSYTELVASPGTTDNIVEGVSNLFFTQARVRATPLTGLSLATGTAITAADTVLTAPGKLQKQITDNAAIAVTKDSSTGAANLPAGTTAQRPANAVGILRYNITLGRAEINNGMSWGSLGGATGGGTDAVFYESDIVVTTDYTVPVGRNAMAAGPITINAGASVTIPAGSTLTIV